MRAGRAVAGKRANAAVEIVQCRQHPFNALGASGIVVCALARRGVARFGLLWRRAAACPGLAKQIIERPGDFRDLLHVAVLGRRVARRRRSVATCGRGRIAQTFHAISKRFFCSHGFPGSFLDMRTRCFLRLRSVRALADKPVQPLADRDSGLARCFEGPLAGIIVHTTNAPRHEASPLYH
ncbi:hypothetical protein D1F64_05825 [Breoghania sp. L-A4]|nr:hypothetical protein D1F64_05825 [Breoghania sp. L-A4]